MSKEMLINVAEGEECRIALLEDGKLDELYMERTSATSHVGNVYKGRVTNVEASIQAAFVDFGLGRNGFLHISDLMPSYFGHRGDDYHETVGRKMARRDRPPIQRCLRRGDEIVVQIIKEGIGTKGPTLNTYLSIPGRILVMMPGVGKMGVSKKIEDEGERRRLRQILDSLKPPKEVGFIIRTAGIGKSKTEIQRDLTYLTRLWQTLVKKRDSGPGPMELYTEGDLVTRTVRDVFTTDVERIVVDSKDVAKRIKDVIKLSNPRAKNKVELYEEPTPIFHKFGIEREIEQMYSRYVPLPSGGSLVIDSTEAVVAIDVNSGKNRDHSDAELTAFKTDMEAADEIPRQLRLRDLGGVIICDFIDLRYERHRRELEKRLHDNLQNDRAKTKVLRMSQFGIIEMTRQRMRPSLKRSIYFDCPHCKGAGLVKTAESMSLDVMRRLTIAMNDLRVARAELAVSPDVSFYLQNKKRAALAQLESGCNKPLVIKSDAKLGLDETKLELFDNRDGLVILEELGMLPQPPHTTQLGPRPQGAQPGRRGDGRDARNGGRDGSRDGSRDGGRDFGRGGRQQRDQRPVVSRRPDPHDPDDEFDIDSAEDALEQREEDIESGPAERVPALPAPASSSPSLAARGPAPAGDAVDGLAGDAIPADDEDHDDSADDDADEASDADDSAAEGDTDVDDAVDDAVDDDESDDLTAVAKTGSADDNEIDDKNADDLDDDDADDHDAGADDDDETAPDDEANADRRDNQAGDARGNYRDGGNPGLPNRQGVNRDGGYRQDPNRNQGYRDSGYRDQGNRGEGNRGGGNRGGGNRDGGNRGGGNRDGGNREGAVRDGGVRDGNRDSADRQGANIQGNRQPANRPPLNRPPYANGAVDNRGDNRDNANRPAGQGYPDDGGEGGGRRRRRRRRGGRGRGRRDRNDNPYRDGIAPAPEPMDSGYAESDIEEFDIGESDLETPATPDNRDPRDRNAGGNRNADNRDAQNRQDRDRQGGDRQSREGQNRDRQNRDANRDPRNADSRNADPRNRDAGGGADSRSGDSRGGDSRGGDSRGGDSRGGDSRDSRNRDSRNRDAGRSLPPPGRGPRPADVNDRRDELDQDDEPLSAEERAIDEREDELDRQAIANRGRGDRPPAAMARDRGEADDSDSLNDDETESDADIDGEAAIDAEPESRGRNSELAPAPEPMDGVAEDVAGEIAGEAAKPAKRSSRRGAKRPRRTGPKSAQSEIRPADGEPAADASDASAIADVGDAGDSKPTADAETEAADAVVAPKRPRRRGGRGRRGGAKTAENTADNVDDDAPVPRQMAAGDSAVADAPVAPGAGRAEPTSRQLEANPLPENSGAESRSADRGAGRPPEPRAPESPTIVRTGSADRHLASDEPIAPQPSVRPRSVRDLDAIPDDFD